MASTTAPIQSPYKFNNAPPGHFGGGKTSRPKSPKQTTIENPYLKNPTFSTRGSSSMMGGSATPQQSMSFRSPLSPLGAINVPSQGFVKSSSVKKPPQAASATPMAPPKTSLSLNESSLFQMQAPAPVAKTPVAHRSPAPVAGGPPSMQSPQYPSARIKSIANSFTGTSTMHPQVVAGDDHWVVGFGFGPTSMGQYQELVSVLLACGTIEQRISGGNWVAVKFSSRYAAEKAISSQPIYSPASNTYFGISRVTPDRLRLLQLHKSNDAPTANTMLENGKTDDKSNQRQKSFDAFPRGKKLEEEDVLLLDDMDEEDLERPTKPRNICERIMWVVFSWQYDADLANEKVHSD